jgi:integrase
MNRERRTKVLMSVAISATAREYQQVLQLIKQHIGDRKMGLIFLNKRGHAMRHTTVLRRHFHPLLLRLGIPQCGFHAFRHGRVSHLVESGASRELIKQWIGHGSHQMIELYLHLYPDYQTAALEKVSSLQPNSAVTSGSSFAESGQVM